MRNWGQIRIAREGPYGANIFDNSSLTPLPSDQPSQGGPAFPEQFQQIMPVVGPTATYVDQLVKALCK